MSTQSNRPVLEVLSSHWLSLLGAALVTTAGFSWLLVLPMQVRGHASNPYIGLLVFIAIPIVFLPWPCIDPYRHLSRKAPRTGRARNRTGPNGLHTTDRGFSRRHNGCKYRHRNSRDLPGGGAYGNGAVLRAELPRHATRVCLSPERVSCARDLRRVPRRAGCHRLAAQ